MSNKITRKEALEQLDILQKRVANDEIGQYYVIFTDTDGEHWDHEYGYTLLELVAVLETAKHMQLQSYVQQTLEEMGPDLEAVAQILHKIMRPEYSHYPNVEWQDLPERHRNILVEALRQALKFK